ncbi:MAG: phosphatase PAP2 family protein [Polyangiaceae bacterium]
MVTILVRLGRDLFLRSDRVVSCGIRQLEIQWFGFGSGRTPGEWLARWHNPTLDLLFAFPYFIFAYFVFIYSAYLYFFDRPRMRTYLWSFAFANFAAFIIWLALPVAPPWYVHQHGCMVDVLASPSAAGLLRVDAALGISYFKTLYGNSAYVFGAMPSMHCAFPMLGLLSAWPHITWKTKPIHIAYVLLMFVASTYLDHHYLVDGLAGFALAFVAVTATRWLLTRRVPVPVTLPRAVTQPTSAATPLAIGSSMTSPADVETSV